MKIIEIGEKEYMMPESWGDVSVAKFEKLAKHNSLLNTYKSETLFTLEMFSLILDAPLDDIKRLDRESFTILASELSWLNSDMDWTGKKEYEIDGENYVCLDNLNKLSMGDSISLELMVGQSSPENILSNILPVLIRKVKKVNKNGKEIMKLEDFDAERFEEIKSLYSEKLMVADVIRVKDFF